MALQRTGMVTMTGRLLLRYLPALVAILLVSGVVLDRVLENGMAREVDASLGVDARAIRRALPEGFAYQPRVASLGEELGLRITLIGTDGTVLADSSADPATMQNHASRPEVRAALHGSTGVASRTSATLGDPYRYLALPPENGVIVRVARPLSQLQSRLARVRATIAGAFSVALLLGVAALLY